MSNNDPNFPNRDIDPNLQNPPSRSWGLLVGLLVLFGLIAFLAVGRNQDTTALNSPAMAPPTSPTITSPPAGPTATLPAARNPTETTGGAARGPQPVAPQ